MESSWRVRGEGYATTVSLAVLGVIVGITRADNPLQLLAGVFPVVVGWIGSVIALERDIARGEGRAAIKSAVVLGCVVALVNLVLFVAVLHAWA